ncbi:hypothetical protein Pedsa_1365 [Pseudopedobacter saltans DSM 12145]|uniref:ATPase n=1 Tax=Pseudopedobacter saltans (strain ATCC 51119 / DSM 12145 / JCM 21818 / CCUG 39354 / LMG 10337 / NBRC 100064 / NCIMB 13643) TaxID=762903 RepID=F0SEP1_PSESL|nr:SRPBCC domain-containing protein [Pseudopedobacter saltans]ADY51931.1 hypothetical protein Pedsa_1365 [Pseudopedobacter saltans DSM 12145]
MKNESYTTTIVVDKDAKTVFNAVKNLKAWWSEDIEGDTDVLNETFFYHYKDVHLSKIKLIEIIPDKRLVYHVIDNQFNFTKDKSEWTNTKLVFDLSEDAAKTKVIFTHEGLVPLCECYNICNDAWTNYIKNSLYKLIVIGKGEPNPKDKDGFNAEIVKKWKLSAIA